MKPGKPIEHLSTASGYTDCTCGECFDVTVSSDTSKPELCELCEEAGCEPEGACCRTDDDEPVEQDDTHQGRTNG